MSIPASQIVQVNPAVLSSGGSSLALNGLFLTENALIPAGKALSFPSAAAVGAYFGLASLEYATALIYFAGYDNSSLKPQAMLFAPYQTANVAAWLRSGSLAGMSLAQLQALPAGTLTISIDGNPPEVSGNINFAGVASFTAAAAAIAAAFAGVVPTVTWNATLSTFVVKSPTTGAESTISFASGALATSLKLTMATGATLSQGDVADTPATALAKAIAASQNWGTVVPLFEPALADKETFGAWLTAQNSRYLGVIWDTDAQAIVSGATEPFGVIAQQNEYDGVLCISGDASVAAANGTTLAAMLLQHAAFVAGTIASINFAQQNGRVTLMFRTLSGLVPSVTDQAIYASLLANGYNCYAQFASANQGFVFFANGNLPGKWKWADSFVNQVYLNAQFQLALMNLLNSTGSIPYSPEGYNMIRAAMLDPIAEAINFGTIQQGVTLSAAQIANVDAAAGSSVHNVIQTQGYYLQIADPGAAVRGNRGTPVINFWYTDGQAVQLISMASINIQ